MEARISKKEVMMKCVICKQGETQSGLTNVTIERRGMILIVKDVPAEVCSNCGESYVNENTTRSILKMAEDALKTGVQVEICPFKAA